MKLHFLGTTGYHPNNRRQTACLMLPEIGVILDAGTGIFRARDLIETTSLKIFLSHAHLDHSIGLTYLFDVVFEKPVTEVIVYAEAEKIETVNEHLFAPGLFPVKPPCEFVAIGSDPVEIPGDGTLTTFSLNHPGGALGFRLDWPGRSLAYVTDTTADAAADYVQAIRGVDVLVHECHFPDGWEKHAEMTGHSCLTPVAEVAREAEVGCLFLGHINPLNESDEPLELASVESIFQNIRVSLDGMVVEF